MTHIRYGIFHDRPKNIHSGKPQSPSSALRWAAVFLVRCCLAQATANAPTSVILAPVRMLASIV